MITEDVNYGKTTLEVDQTIDFCALDLVEGAILWTKQDRWYFSKNVVLFQWECYIKIAVIKVVLKLIIFASFKFEHAKRAWLKI